MMIPSGRKEAEDWWRTTFVWMEPNQISIRSCHINDLIGAIGFVDIICLCMRGDFPSKGFFLVFTQQKLRLPCRICRGWFQHA